MPDDPAAPSAAAEPDHPTIRPTPTCHQCGSPVFGHMLEVANPADNAQAVAPDDPMYEALARDQLKRWGYDQTLSEEQRNRWVTDQTNDSNLRTDVDFIRAGVIRSYGKTFILLAKAFTAFQGAIEALCAVLGPVIEAIVVKDEATAADQRAPMATAAPGVSWTHAHAHDHDSDPLVAVAVLATALDNLGARIHRDIHVESSYIDLTGNPLAATLSDFSAYADECLAALDHPAVRAATATDRDTAEGEGDKERGWVGA